MWNERNVRAIGKTAPPPAPGTVPIVSSTSKRQAARTQVAAYHEAQQAALVGHIGDAIDRYRVGELNAFDVHQVVFQYSRAARELWKFCNLASLDLAAVMIRDDLPINWWEVGAPKRR